MKNNCSTKQLREEMGLTQEQLSRKYEIPLRTVQNWESRFCCPAYVLRMMQWNDYLERENQRLEKLVQK